MFAFPNTTNCVKLRRARMTFPFQKNFRLALLLFALVPVVVRAQISFTGSYFLHDPGTLIKSGSSYFIYGDGQGISGITSTDLRNWNNTAVIFPNGPPAWTSNSVPGFTGYFWAPDNAYFNGRYNLYYSCSIFGTINSAIGLVTTPSLTAPVWTDQGKVIQSNPNFATNATTDLTAYNCIDPSVLVDTNGTVWLSFGSYSDGILVMQLDPTTGNRIAPNSPITKVASSSTSFFSNTEEGSFLYQRGGFYYLFVNFGGCCAGVNSTYNIRVGRSANVTGPYLDKSGANMLTGGGTMAMESTGRYIGPGHPGILNDNGTNWFTYHYYDAKNNGAPTVGMSRLYWAADGWPAVTNDWSALYTFSTDAREHLALYNASLQNNASITNDASRGNVLNLDGATNQVTFPLSVANASTFAAWVKWSGGADWQRIFDFGTNTLKYFFLTPRANTGKMRFAIRNGGGEQIIDASSGMPTNSWCHVAVSLDGAKGILYLNGNPVGTNSALTIRPWQLLARSNYVGKSQFAADPMFNGRIGSFRIFGRPLGGAEIRDLAWTHPLLAHRYSFNSGTTNVWDSIGLAHGTLAGNAVLTNNALKLTGASGGYVNLPGGLVSGSSALTVEFWATFGVNGNYARVFDFGNISGANGSQYIFFSPHTGTGAHRTEIATSSTVTFDIPGTFDNRTLHVACIVDPASGYTAIYTNGVLEKALTNALPVLTGVNKSWGFIGRSLWSGDAYLNATIDELRIYDGRLTPQEIATDFQFGPDALALPVSITQSNSPPNFSLSWPSWAVGFAAQGSSDLASWATNGLAPALANDRWSLLISPTNAANFYRLQR